MTQPPSSPLPIEGLFANPSAALGDIGWVIAASPEWQNVKEAMVRGSRIDTSGVTRRRPHPHTARHTFFTHAGEAGVLMDTLKTVGGHKDSKVTSGCMGLTDAGGKAARDLLEARYLGSD
jgi:integrase